MLKVAAVALMLISMLGCIPKPRTLVSLTPQRDYAIRETSIDNVFLIITRDVNISDTPNLEDAMDYLGCGACSLHLHLDGMIWEVEVLAPRN